MSAISAGDLVMITGPSTCRCGDSDGVGLPFKVESVIRSDWTCPFCGYYHEAPELLAAFEPGGWIEARRLIKIDPLPETQEVEQEEALTA